MASEQLLLLEQRPLACCLWATWGCVFIRVPGSSWHWGRQLTLGSRKQRCWCDHNISSILLSLPEEDSICNRRSS